MQIVTQRRLFAAKLMRFHVYALAPEAHAFRFQSQPLFNSRIPAQLDLTA